ncbi:MAG: DUF4845 domain-containing protein [Proteobacteria bacterium]|nr:DUF4845 domain-containing protein [Pseudomonadota bacterium]
MKNLRNKQRGIGFLGWTTILGVFACFVLLGLRVFPLYNEKFTVMAAMKSVANQPDAAKMSTKDVRKYFLRSMELANTTRFTDKTIKQLAKVVTDKKTKKRYIHVVYEGRNALVKDIKLLIEFDHKIELGGSGGE